MTEPTITPALAWENMRAGNQRFISGSPRHPHQDAERRSQISSLQTPQAALFGCSDSRLAAEIIFDQGLGDLFVVRNAGHVLSSSVLGSLEYAITVLGVPLIVVLSHDSCGAVLAAIQQSAPDAAPLPPHIASITEAIAPAVKRAYAAARLTPGEPLDPEQVGGEHLSDTVSGLLSASELISEAVALGKLGIVGANYTLAEGRVTPTVIRGTLEHADTDTSRTREK